MLKTGKEYIASIKAMRPNVYKWGKLIEDVTTNPITASHVNAVARCYDACFDPETAAIYTNKSIFTGETAHRWNVLITKPEDVIGNARMKRESYRMNGSCTGSICAGWTILNAMWGITHECDKEYGTNYHDRLVKFFKLCEDNAYALAGALTDAKGDRSLRAGQQKDPDAYLHVKEQREDGIVLKGFKIQICGVIGANYILVMPETGFSESEKSCAVVAAVPRDAEGLTIVETRRPSDTRVEEEGWDGVKSGTTQSYLLFDDVFVPNDFVFLNGEYKYSGMVITNFTTIYRAAFGGCTTGQGDVIIGTALAMARANGLKQKAFQDKLTQMVIMNETAYGTGYAAAYNGHEWHGSWMPESLLSHITKVHVSTLPYEGKRMAIEIAGGIAETGCMPSYEDIMSPIYGEKLLRSLKGGEKVSAEDRIKLARLLEWLTAGAGIPGCLHGGGSPDTARMLIKASTDWEKMVGYAKNLVGVESSLSEK